MDVYLISADYPQEERYGITGQIRRAALSVGSNIAEASKRKSPKDKSRILNVSQSEGAEVMSVFDMVDRLSYGRRGTARDMIAKYDELEGMIESLSQRILAEHEGQS